MPQKREIQLRGVEVHNLKQVDLDLAHGQLIVLCGPSGSGKSSLALDTLYAEGQRRYIESFSAYTRQFLARLDKPATERIDGIPPAIAITHKNAARSARATVGTATETNDYLRLLMARIGETSCPSCGRPVQRDSPDSTASAIESQPAGSRAMVAAPVEPEDGEELASLFARLRGQGIVRAVVGNHLVDLASDLPDESADVFAVIDRVTTGKTSPERLRDSVETAFEFGRGECVVLNDGDVDGEVIEIDGRLWCCRRFSRHLRCGACGIELPDPEPRLFSFNSPLGACPTCEGFGNLVEPDMDLIVPDRRKSLAEGAIAPWTTPAYAHELEELLELAPDYEIPTEIPFRDLSDDQLRLIEQGVPERDFGGLRGFFAWLEKRKYKMHLRVFLSRWKSARPCPDCHGARLRPEALATRIGGRNMAEICAMKIQDAAQFLDEIELSDWQRDVGRLMIDQVSARLKYLLAVGLGYLPLDRSLKTLSGGEAGRVALTSVLGSNLVRMLYVLDEPSVGLHPANVEQLVASIERLRDRGNTVVVVEHEEAIIRAADEIVEIGPGAGEQGGQIVFQGPPDLIEADDASPTGAFLAGRRGVGSTSRRPANRGRVRLTGARGHNLQNITVEFPLGVLCVVSGVSGAGKSTLVNQTLYGALRRRMRKDSPVPLPYDDVFGEGQIDDVVLVDQSPIGRSSRSNPVTYVKAFDEIRNVFAETADARLNNFGPGHFSFNVDGGRCPECSGDGMLAIDMQFLADVFMTCPECGGKRYRPEILRVAYRGRNIADVLAMTVRDAFTFFRGHGKVQTRLKRLMDVGLDYLRLGQPAGTLSGGESQRLKLAGYLAASRRRRTLFLLDEPTTGLHFADIVQLLDCFDTLLSVGHSLIVIEHNLQLMKSADYLVDLGPGAADEGGQVVAVGTPEEVAGCERSITGRYLASSLANIAEPTA